MITILKKQLWVPGRRHKKPNPKPNFLIPGHLYLRRRISLPNGDIEFDSGWDESKSFLKIYAQHIFCAFGHADVASVLDTTNTARTLQRPADGANVFMNATAPNDDDAYGLLVGDQASPTAVDITDYALQSKIAHGTGAGQLDYEVMAVDSFATDSTSAQFEFRRNYINSSSDSGTITVTEIVLAVQSVTVGSTTNHALIRDVLSSGDAIAHNRVYTVEYTYKITE